MADSWRSGRLRILGVSLLLTLAAWNAARSQDDATAGVDVVDTQTRLGQALRDLDRDEEALEAFRKVLELDPDNVAAHFNLGGLLAGMGEREAALEHLQRAVELDAASIPARYELAEVMRRSDRWEEALAGYRAVVELDPEHENAHIGEADALVATGRFEQARERLEAGRQRFPESRGFKFGQAWLLAACPDAGLRDPEVALELAQELFTARRSLGAAELIAAARAGAGRCDEAAELQRFVIDQGTGFEQPPEVMARFERELAWYEARPCSIPESQPVSERPEWPRKRS